MRKYVVSIMPLIADAFYLPGIIPRSYGVNDVLPISMSSKLTSDFPRVHAKSKWYKEEIHLSRDTLREYDMCDPEDGYLLEKTKHTSTVGYFADQIINTAY
jgi:hypothetical protein